MTPNLPADATMDGIPVTLYPGFDGYVRYTLRKAMASVIVHHSSVIVFDEIPDKKFNLDRYTGRFIEIK
jgi:hypothetical protein